MSTDVVHTVIKGFLCEKRTRVLAIKGKWGVGKTYAWRQWVRDCPEIWPPRYSYVSLFGISSIAELQIAILTQSEHRGPESDAAKVTVPSVVDKAWRWMLGRMQSVKKLPYVKHVQIELEAIAPSLIRDTLVCLDDFERLDTSRVTPEQILGLISRLKEERGCKVAIIFNDEELADGGATYEKYREKVVDVEVEFSPSSEEAANLGVPATVDRRNLIVDRIAYLQINNIRLIARFADLVQLVQTELAGLHDTVVSNAIRSCILLMWIEYGTGPEKPSSEFFRGWGGAILSRMKGQKGEVPANEARWSRVLEGYGHLHTDEFDLAMQKVVKCGYVEGTGMLDHARRQDAQIRAGEIEGEFERAWRLFHDSFNDNEEELVKALNGSFRKAVRFISPMNLDATVQLLRRLDRAADAEGMIELFVRERSGTPELFYLDADPFGSEVRDVAVRTAFEAQRRATQVLPTAADALHVIAKKRGWSVEEMRALKEASTDDLYRIFKATNGRVLGAMVSVCLSFTDPENRSIAERAQAALTRIAGESRLNRIRVQKYSIELVDEIRPGGAERGRDGDVN